MLPKVLLIISCYLLLSCYSFTATTLPAHIRTVNIADVDYRSFDPVIGNRLKDGLRELFRINAPAVRIINDNADADFTVALLSYSNRPEAHSSSATVETYRVTMGVSVSFYDNVRKKMIYENRNVQAIGSYDVQKNESEAMHGQERAIRALQEIIVANALAKW
ncbi:MAG: LPS assembly lipoprotein LptE [Fibromonadales bacterium]|nr:LPS assembly lipoprotein LptE [Fibromonadales bacterium]